MRPITTFVLSLLFVQTLFITPLSVKGCSLEQPKSGQEYAIEMIVANFNGDIVSSEYLRYFALSADCSVYPPAIRTQEGDLIIEGPRDEFYKINLSSDQVIRENIEFQTQYLDLNYLIYSINQVILTETDLLKLDFQDTVGNQIILERYKLNLVNGSQSKTKFDVSQYIIGTGFNYSNEYRLNVDVADIYHSIEKSLIITNFKPINATLADKNWIIAIDFETGNITHRELSREDEDLKYKQISSWNDYFIISYTSNEISNGGGLHIFDKQLELIREISVDFPIFLHFNDILIYSTNGEFVIHDIAKNNVIESPIDVFDSIILKDFMVSFLLDVQLISSTSQISYNPFFEIFILIPIYFQQKRKHLRKSRYKAKLMTY